MGIDVILHAEFIFDNIFDRGRMEIDHLKRRFFTKGFLKDIYVYWASIRIREGKST